MSGFDHWNWMPVPVDLELVACPPARSLKAHNLKILHLQCGVPPSDSQAIKVAAVALQNHNYKFQYRTLEPNQLGNVVSYYRELADCDLFIEQISQPDFGVLALEAMAHAKTVISGNSVRSKKIWPQLSMSPVLDVDYRSIHRQLESVVREPICLKDLSKRSRSYIETYHNAEVVVAQMVEQYAKLIDRG